MIEQAIVDMVAVATGRSVNELVCNRAMPLSGLGVGRPEMEGLMARFRDFFHVELSMETLAVPATELTLLQLEDAVWEELFVGQGLA